jgi:tetratricopeptide (TPR) repeat protein
VGAPIPFDDEGFTNVTAGVVGRGARSLAARLVHLNPGHATNWKLLGSALHASAVASPVYASPVLATPSSSLPNSAVATVPATSEVKSSTAAASPAAVVVPAVTRTPIVPRRHDASTAIRILSFFLTNNKSSGVDPIPVTLALCDCYLLRRGEGDIKEAQTLLTSLESSDALSKALIARQYARLKLASNDSQGAIKLYRDALRLIPDHPGLWEELAIIYYNQTSPSGGSNNTTNGGGAVAVGDLCLRTALSALQAPSTHASVNASHWRTISRDAVECRLLLRLARSHYYSKRYPAGLAAAERAISQTTTGSMSPTAYFIHSLFLRKLRKWKEATTALQTSLQLYTEQLRTGASSHHGAPYGLLQPSRQGPSLVHMSLFHLHFREKDFAVCVACRFIAFCHLLTRVVL